jgi:putative oxidoreductase
MKIAMLIARSLLGLIFLVFGLNPFLHFLPAILPPGLAGQFLSVLIESHYVLFIGVIQLIGGALLLVNRYVPFALTLLGPVIVNILLYHLLLSHAGAGLSIFVTVLWGLLFFRHRQYFSSLFVQRAA